VNDATEEMTVDSPPGIIRAWADRSSGRVRIGMAMIVWFCGWRLRIVSNIHMAYMRWSVGMR